ncbi:MAG TPA: ABC transporter substrate-binding protein [Acidimicrobiales bacterium]|jgi:branched-chain amino acid transport system substrate-binding protein|nr:ABC transporter substrate-binding protein [Acidimicrobiales bacterium]
MRRSRPARLVVLLAALAIAAAACSSDNKTSSGGEGGSGSGGTAQGGTYKVDTSNCPPEVSDKITGTVKIGTTMPLSGGAAAAAFAPVADGLKAYVQYANKNNVVPGYQLSLSIEDDQFNPTLTTPAVEKLRDQTGVNLFAGMIGTANNLAVRDSLNSDCIPQLLANSGDPRWGDVKNFPWTTGALAPYNTETAIYVDDIKKQFPNGTTAAMFNVNSDFGQDYRDTFQKLAGDAKIDIVDQQTIEGADSSPPTSQVTSIASKKPDVILAVPLGAQCPAFLKEVANAKAANPGWTPRIYITATCASTLLLALAGPAADGIVTIVSGKDVADPKNASDPQVVSFKQAMTDYGFKSDGDYPTASAGWAVGELTAQILKQAASSPDGLTRASIIDAARNFDYHPTLAREGAQFKMNGETDPYLNEQEQVVQYNASSKTYTDIGSLNTTYEGKTEKPS